MSGGVIDIDLARRGRAARLPKRVSPRREQLTARDVELLDLLVSDPSATRADFAAAMGISENAVKAHLKRAYRVLGADNRTHAYSIWVERRAEPIAA